MNLIYIILTTLITQASEITVYFFYKPSCGHCQDILQTDLPAWQAKYRFVLKKYDIDLLENLQLLEKMEAKVADKTDDLPVVFIGDSVFYGPEETRAKFGSTLKLLAGGKPPVNPDTIRPPADTVVCLADTVNLYYFYQAECSECGRTEALLAGMTKKYQPIRIWRYDLFNDSSKLLYEALAAARGIPENQRLVAPTIIIGDDWLIKDIPSSALEDLIRKYPAGSPRLDTISIGSAGSIISNRFQTFSALGVLAAGFLDGINPCAFATIVFFISYLVFAGRRRRDIMIMALFFILAVFISYFAIGLGAYRLLHFFAGFKFLAVIMFRLFGIMAIVLGILSLYDFYAAQRGQTSKMILQLPLIIKQRIHKSIKEKTGSGGIIIGSLTTGFLISFLEFGCTGQVYLPTITFIIAQRGLSLQPIGYLLLYNLMFILPLVVIALAASILSTQQTAAFLEKKIPLVKMVTAFLFFGLGVALLLTT